MYSKHLALAGLLCLAAISGCGKSESASAGDSAPLKPAGGVISGKVTYADGKPIDAPGADISINIYGVSTAGEKVSYSPAVKADGTYRQKAVPGSYRFNNMNTVKVTFDGQNVLLPLEPIGSNWSKDQDVADGIVQDFVLKLTGRTPNGNGSQDNFTDWYGVSIKPMYSGYRNDLKQSTKPLPEHTKLTFNLKPTGPRIDGKPAEPVTVEREYTNYGVKPSLLNDLPCADYDMTGTITFPDGTTKPMVFEVKYAQFQPVQPVKFSTGSSTGFWPVNGAFAYNN